MTVFVQMRMHALEICAGRAAGGDCGDAIGAGAIGLRHHHDLSAEALHCRFDALVIRGDQNVIDRATSLCLLIDMLDHRFAQQLDQRFARES